MLMQTNTHTQTDKQGRKEEMDRFWWTPASERQCLVVVAPIAVHTVNKKPVSQRTSVAVMATRERRVRQPTEPGLNCDWTVKRGFSALM